MPKKWNESNSQKKKGQIKTNTKRLDDEFIPAT
jgi:hypothetical protein